MELKHLVENKKLKGERGAHHESLELSKVILLNSCHSDHISLV